MLVFSFHRIASYEIKPSAGEPLVSFGMIQMAFGLKSDGLRGVEQMVF